MSGKTKGLGEDYIDDHCHSFENDEQEDMVHENSHCQNKNEKIQDLVDQEIASGLHAILFMFLDFTFYNFHCNFCSF